MSISGVCAISAALTVEPVPSVHARTWEGSPIPVAVVMKLTSQKRRKLPPRRQGPKTMEVVTSDKKKKMVISSTILNSRYVLGRYSPSLRSLHAAAQPVTMCTAPEARHALPVGDWNPQAASTAQP